MLKPRFLASDICGIFFVVFSVARTSLFLHRRRMIDRPAASSSPEPQLSAPAREPRLFFFEVIRFRLKRRSQVPLLCPAPTFGGVRLSPFPWGGGVRVESSEGGRFRSEPSARTYTATARKATREEGGCGGESGRLLFGDCCL